ncbi:MAG: F0F1 ATP synthase subunit A [Sedimentibacter sp.]|uniref:F0F1 ATP synthase subunit A n=1 Tax=Sedimentibacter sp. TaxID=1960295 RepID=UPI003158629C
MNHLAEELMHELTCETVFVIPVLGGIEVLESVVVTWVIMAILLIASLLLTKNLKVDNIGKGQLLLEAAVGGLQNMIEGITGDHGKKFVPYLTTVLIFLGIANTSALFGFKPPTKDLNVTLGLAIMSIVLTEWAKFQKKGARKFFKSFAEPVAVVAPINVLEIFIRPLSLCMRLYGNVLGAFVVMELIKLIIPVGVPVPFSLYFDIFDGLIQAYVFVFLTSLFIKEAIE